MEAVLQLEKEFAAWSGTTNVVACASGTAALHLALAALRLPPGSEVVLPDYTMIACARAVALAGLTPVFVDCGPDLLMDPAACAAAITDRTRAIMPVHVYGRRCAMDRIHALARQHDLRVVEDLAEGHGIPPHPHSDACCWSFYRNKIIAGEEGGCVAFKNGNRAMVATSLRSLGFTESHDFYHLVGGHNYRMANSLARLILRSLKRADQNIGERRGIERWYDTACPEEWRLPERHVPWVYDLRIPGLTRDQQDAVVRALQEAGIEARHGFKPMSWQVEFKGCRAVGAGGGLPMRAALASCEVLYCPIQPGVTSQWACVQAFDVIRGVLDAPEPATRTA